MTGKAVHTTPTLGFLQQEAHASQTRNGLPDELADDYYFEYA
jgi:hypothetical protein